MLLVSWRGEVADTDEEQRNISSTPPLVVFVTFLSYELEDTRCRVLLESTINFPKFEVHSMIRFAGT